MQKHFSEHFRPTEDQTKALWAEAVFIFDTNVLLNLYRLSNNTSKQIRQILKSLTGRLFLPHQVAIEFFDNREEVIAEQVNGFERARQALNKIPSAFRQDFTRHPCIPIDDIVKSITDCVRAQSELVTSSQKTHQVNFLQHDDPILSELESLFSLCSEPPYPPPENDALNKQVDERINSNAPPCNTTTGTKASIPAQNHPHRGDGRVWFQVIKFARDNPDKAIIFVTGDQKPNWWRTAKIGTDNQAIGPHFLLIKEVESVSKKKFLMYTQEQFLQLTVKYLKAQDQSRAIQEVKLLRESMVAEALADLQKQLKATFEVFNTPKEINRTSDRKDSDPPQNHPKDNRHTENDGGQK